MIILLTGAAGFVGFHSAIKLLDAGHTVIGVDNLNHYYDPALKQGRLAILRARKGFTFHELDIAEAGGINRVLGDTPVTHILHLAAQAGVRYSLKAPRDYVHSNVMGHLEVLEYARHSDTVEHVAYASSSSVYGEREADISGGGFSETDRVREPASLYAATKLGGEMISESYARLYGMSLTGLRFFTVYGPWGRPDMAYWIFTEKILNGEPITLFAPDIMLRDFTYVDDIVNVFPQLLATPPKTLGEKPGGHAIYNLGNHSPAKLMELVGAVEDACGQKAETIIKPQQPGDVRATFADVTAAQRDFGFVPATSLDVGIKRFVDWYKSEWI